MSSLAQDWTSVKAVFPAVSHFPAMSLQESWIERLVFVCFLAKATQPKIFCLFVRFLQRVIKPAYKTCGSCENYVHFPISSSLYVETAYQTTPSSEYYVYFWVWSFPSFPASTLMYFCHWIQILMSLYIFQSMVFVPAPEAVRSQCHKLDFCSLF